MVKHHTILLLRFPGKIFICCFALALIAAACSGTKKYFRAAERLEKQGLVDEAADYYLESLIRKPTNVEARIKLKEVGQKYVSSLSSEFFREVNTGQLEPSLTTFERLKEFHSRCASMNVQLDYPRAYDEDYQNQVEKYCSKNYHRAQLLVKQKKYQEAETYIKKVKKYNANYKSLPELEIVATCEPLYQSAISSLESKNYAGAYNLLLNIRSKTEKYKDLPDLIELATEQNTRSFILFEPRAAANKADKDIADYLYGNFSQVAQQQQATIRVINNSPFQDTRPGFEGGSGDVDLAQAIRKATGADYFYMFDIVNRSEHSSGPSRTPSRGFQERRYKKGDDIIYEYKPFDYNLVKAQRVYQYEFRYRLINAYSSQVVSSGTEIIRAQDNVEYNEFTSPNLIQQLFGKANPSTGDLNSLFPYNPSQTPPINRFNPNAWRGKFNARTGLKSYDDLRIEAMKSNVTLFNRVFNMMK